MVQVAEGSEAAEGVTEVVGAALEAEEAVTVAVAAPSCGTGRGTPDHVHINSLLQNVTTTNNRYN